MPLTAAEKQRRYRERLKQNVNKSEESKRKARERYHAKKRLIDTMSDREKRRIRRSWREQKKHQRCKQTDLLRVLEYTPPSSPGGQNETNSTRGRKKLRRDRSKLYAENKRLRIKNEHLEKKVNKYKSRLYRERRKQTQIKPLVEALSPLSKTEALIQECLPGIKGGPGLENVKRQVLKYQTLTHALSSAYNSNKDRHKKETLRCVLKNKSIRKYRLIKEICVDAFGLKTTLRRYTKSGSKLDRTVTNISRFFNRDDVSRTSAGKKETVTRKKNKVQKRYLLDTMKNLHKTFLKEGGVCSYSTFVKFRPFYIVSPTVAGRDTCLCKLHSNIHLKFNSLKHHRVLTLPDMMQIIKMTVCSVSSKQCMYNECSSCRKKDVRFSSITANSDIAWSEWVRKEEVYKKEGKEVKVTKIVKSQIRAPVSELRKRFVEELTLFKKHIYNIKQQYQQYRYCLDNLKPHEVALHIDFSENYNCKLAEEVQGHHFGASRNQITLHTGVLYCGIKRNEPISFCTVSSCNEHNPAAIWAHLDPIMNMIKQSNDQVDTLHIFSDGPFTQYRQKQNFYLFNKKVLEYGFKLATWSFFEAGHGKGAADGIGGVIKRTADRIVAMGQDIIDASEFIEKVQKQTSVKLMLISDEEISKIRKSIPANINVLKGTKDVHQLITKNVGSLTYRCLSCFCTSSVNNIKGLCDCFGKKIYTPLKTQAESVNNQIIAGCSGIKQKNRYNDIYTSSDSDDDQPLASLARDNDLKKPAAPKCISTGSFLLIQIASSKKKATQYRYVGVAQSEVDEDDGELKVMFLKAIDNGANKFRIDEEDISYVAVEQVLAVLRTPVLKSHGDRFYYQFNTMIDIFEK